jgi:hypothetical protein
MKVTFKSTGLVTAAVALLAAWQATNFALDYRAILGAVVAAGAGWASPRK